MGTTVIKYGCPVPYPVRNPVLFLYFGTGFLTVNPNARLNIIAKINYTWNTLYNRLLDAMLVIPLFALMQPNNPADLCIRVKI